MSNSFITKVQVVSFHFIGDKMLTSSDTGQGGAVVQWLTNWTWDQVGQVQALVLLRLLCCVLG